MNKNQAQLLEDYGKDALGVPELPSEPVVESAYFLVFDGEKWTWQTDDGGGGSPE